MRVGLWSIDDEGLPRRLEQRRHFLEVDLEGWIEAHPELVMDGLVWVGRQVTLPGRSRIDLVGLTREGQLVVAELKRGVVDIAALTQVLSYTLAIAAMEPEAFLGRLRLDDEQRDLLLAGHEADGALDLSVMLVGTARSPELDRASEWLTARGLDLPTKIITFVPFRDGERVLLAREVTEQEQLDDEVVPRRRTSRRAKVEWIQQRARELGVGAVIEEAIAMAGELGLKVRPWPKSLTIVPGTGLQKTLIYLGVPEEGLLGFGYSVETIAELYGADEDEVHAALGPNWRNLSVPEARTVLASFGALMLSLQTPDDEPG